MNVSGPPVFSTPDRAITMKALTQFSRYQEIQKIRGTLERDSFPRLQMSFLVLLTGASGFFASYLLLHSGLTEMWLRYLASFAAAYLMFLCLLWLWLRTRAQDYIDFPDISGLTSSDSSTFCGGRGGNFGGGGTTVSFDGADSSGVDVGNSGTSVGDALGSVADADEFSIPLFLLILIGAIVCSSLFVIYSAPVLFAELLVDGVWSASLYRKLRGIETRHWLETALRRTFWPFILTAAIVSAAGWGMARYAPEAHSIGDVVVHAKLSD